MKVLTLRLEDKDHQNLRKISFLSDMPMSELLREGTNFVIKKYTKILNRKDEDIIVSIEDNEENK